MADYVGGRLNKRYYLSPLLGLILLIAAGCSESDPPVVDTFRGNPISGDLTGVLRIDQSPYLAVDTLRVPVGQELIIQPGVEIRFDLKTDNGREVAIPLEVYGKITAVGTESAPIVFTSGRRFPDRGDWEGVWLINADPTSRFEYCKFQYGAKYGRRYHYRMVGTQLDSTLYEYGQLTLINSSPTVKRSWFLAAGFHGLHVDSLSNPVIENSIFYDNAGHGVFVHDDSDPTIHNSIIIENDDYGIYFRQTGEGSEPRANANITYSIIWSNFSGEFRNSPPGMGRISQTNENLDSCDYQFNLRLNPAFQDAENWDFRLTPCSAAIDAGPNDPRDPDGTRSELGIHAYNYRPGEIRRRITVSELTAARSPYYMSCDVILPHGQTLDIEPGVTILVEGWFAFRVRGILISHGTADAPIQVLSANNNPKKGDWQGFIFPSDAEDSSQFLYTTIAHARWGLWLKQTDVIIDHCRIMENDSIGIFCDDFSSPDITNSEFYNNSIAAIVCQLNSSPKIIRNKIHGSADTLLWHYGSSGYGIQVKESSRPIIMNNLIYNIGTTGIRLENLSHAEIINNTFARIGYYGVYCLNNSSPDIRNNIFCGNGSELRGGYALIATQASRPTIEYNNFWMIPNDEVSVVNPGDYDPAMNQVVEPGFENYRQNNFRLKSDSPLKNSGDPTLTNRDGSRSDLGAYGGQNSLDN